MTDLYSISAQPSKQDEDLYMRIPVPIGGFGAIRPVVLTPEIPEEDEGWTSEYFEKALGWET